MQLFSFLIACLAISAAVGTPLANIVGYQCDKPTRIEQYAIPESCDAQEMAEPAEAAYHLIQIGHTQRINGVKCTVRKSSSVFQCGSSDLRPDADGNPAYQVGS